MFVRLLVLWIYLVATSLHMVGASTTGVGSIIAGVWFLADAGTLLFNLVVNQENRGLGDIIDDSIGHKYNIILNYDIPNIQYRLPLFRQRFLVTE